VSILPPAPPGTAIPFTLEWSAAGGHSGSTSFAVAVCAELVISDVEIVDLTDSSARVTWTTNVPATSRVTYGFTTPETVVEDTILRTEHSVALEGLELCMDYVLEVSSASPDCYQVTDSNGGAYYGFRTTGGALLLIDSTDTPVNIPDNNDDGASSVVAVETPYSVIDVNVLVNITHTYTGDLELSLIGPGGTEVMLSENNGGSGNDYVDTLFDDEAAASIADGSAPFSGSYRPDEPLTALDSLPAQGDWTLHVVDEYGQDIGTIDSWQLQVKVNEPCDDPEAFFADGFENGDCSAWSNMIP